MCMLDTQTYAVIDLELLTVNFTKMNLYSEFSGKLWKRLQPQVEHMMSNQH